MEFKFWAVREGKESDPNWSDRDPGLQSLSDILTPIWQEPHDTLASFVSRAVELLTPHFTTIVQHADTTWYKDEHQDTCRFETICCNFVELSLVDDHDPMPIKGHIALEGLLSEL